MTTLREGTLHIVLLFYAAATVFLQFAEFRLSVHRTSSRHGLSFANGTCHLVPLFLDQRLLQLRSTLPLLRLLSDHQLLTDTLLNAWSILLLPPLAYLTTVRIRLIEPLLTGSLILRFLHSLVLFVLSLFPGWVQLRGVLFASRLFRHLLGGDMFFYTLCCAYIVYMTALADEAALRSSLAASCCSSLHDASALRSIDDRLADSCLRMGDLFLYLMRAALVFVCGCLFGFVILVALDSTVILVDCDLSIFAYMNTILVSIACAYYLNFVLPVNRSLRRSLSRRNLDRSQSSIVSAPENERSAFLRLAEHCSSLRRLTMYRLRQDYQLSVLHDLRSCSFPARLCLLVSLLLLLASQNALPYTPFSLDGQLLDVYVVTQRLSAPALAAASYYFYQLLRISSFAIGIFIGHMLFTCVKLTFCRAMVVSFAVTVSSFFFYLAAFRFGGLISFYTPLFDTFRHVALTLLLVAFVYNFRAPCRLGHLVFRLTLAFCSLAFLRTALAHANVVKFIDEFRHAGGSVDDDRNFASVFFLFSTVNVVALGLHPLAILLYMYLRCLIGGTTCDYLAAVCHADEPRDSGCVSYDREMGVELTNMHQLQIASVHRLASADEERPPPSPPPSPPSSQPSQQQSPPQVDLDREYLYRPSPTPRTLESHRVLLRQQRVTRLSSLSSSLPPHAPAHSASAFKRRPDSPYSKRRRGAHRDSLRIQANIFNALLATSTAVASPFASPVASATTETSVDHLEQQSSPPADEQPEARELLPKQDSPTRRSSAAVDAPPVPARSIAVSAIPRLVRPMHPRSTPPPKPKRSFKVVRFATEVETLVPATNITVV